MVDFCNMTPDELVSLDLSTLTPQELRALDYFVWCFYIVEPKHVVEWRERQLLPLIEALPDQDFDDDEDEDDDSGPDDEEEFV